MLMVISNPPNSNVRAVLDMGTASVNSNTITLATILFDPSSPSGTATVTPVALNTQYASTAPVCTVVAGGGHGVSYTGGTVIQNIYVATTMVFTPTDAVLSPGHSLAVVYTFSSSTNTGIMAIRWFEIPLT